MVGIFYLVKLRKILCVMVLLMVECFMWVLDFVIFEGVCDLVIFGLLMGCGLCVIGLVWLNDSNLIYDVIDDKLCILLYVCEKGDKECLVLILE